jgi:putative ABC transport system ATP-binding protein
MDLDRFRREQTAVIYQDYGLFPLLTVLENIMYPMELCHVPKKQAMEDARVLAKMALLQDGLLDRYPGQLSGGEQQRVSIARALAMDRRLLLADEPTGNLDTENSDKIMDLLLDLAHGQNRCIIVVTHDIAEPRYLKCATVENKGKTALLSAVFLFS